MSTIACLCVSILVACLAVMLFCLVRMP